MIKYPPVDWFRTQTFWQIGLAAAGGTFVDWTVNYLLGISNHLGIYQHGYSRYAVPDIPSAPGSINAHEHYKNHPETIGDIIWHAFLLHELEPESLHTFYCFTHTESIKNAFYLEKNFEGMTDFFNRIPRAPKIIISADFEMSALFLHYRHLRARQNIHDVQQLIDRNQYLREKTRNLADIWLQREICALDIYHQRRDQQHLLNLQGQLHDSLRHHVLSLPISTVFQNLHSAMQSIMKEFSHLPWQTARLEPWARVYESWKLKNYQIQWFIDMPNWIDAIITGKRTKLPDIDQLAQCCLEAELLNRGFSVRNQGLTELPKWTDQYEIEPCMHQIN